MELKKIQGNQTDEIDNGDNKTIIVIKEYYTGTKTLKEKMLDLMIYKIKYEQSGETVRGGWTHFSENGII